MNNITGTDMYTETFAMFSNVTNSQGTPWTDSLANNTLNTFTSEAWDKADYVFEGNWNIRRNGSFLFGYLRQRTEYQLLGVVVVMLMLISLMGNTMVCLVMTPKLWSGTPIPLNILVFFLAISDILKVVFEMLPKTVEYFYLEWVMGRAMCKMTSMLRSLFSEFSMSTVALISFERYRSVDKPMGTAFNVHSLSVALLIVCVWNIVCCIPQAFWFETVVIPYSTTTICTIPFPSRATALYTSLTRVTNFFVPLTATWLCYMGVIHKTIKSRTRVSHSIRGHQNGRHWRVSQKVTITCFFLTALCTICLTPMNSALLVLEYGSAAHRKQAAKCLRYLWLMTLLKSTTNPFIYGLMWENFRKSVRKLLQPHRRKNVVAPISSQRSKRLTSDRSPDPAARTIRTERTDLDMGSLNNNIASMTVKNINEEPNSSQRGKLQNIFSIVTPSASHKRVL